MPISIENKNKKQTKKKETLELNHIGHHAYHETFNVLPGKQANVLIRDKLSHQHSAAAAATGAIYQGTQEMICHDDIVGSSDEIPMEKGKRPWPMHEKS